MTLWEAESVENNNVVSSDDPDAVRKLKEKLQDLEARRQNIKDCNKLARKEGKEQAPAYVLQNLGGNIQRVKERIKALEARHGQESTEERAGDVRIISNVEANRVQIFFQTSQTRIPGRTSKGTVFGGQDETGAGNAT